MKTLQEIQNRLFLESIKNKSDDLFSFNEIQEIMKKAEVGFDSQFECGGCGGFCHGMKRRIKMEEKYYIIYNDGEGWKLWSSSPDIRSYWEEFISSQKQIHSSREFKILKEVN